MNKDLKEKLAFTLAEVLITLGIIGVVAALTIPTLIKKYQEKVTVTKLKQSYSMLAQAFQMAVTENGPVTSWDLGTGMTNSQLHANIANYLKPYLKLSADCVGQSVDYTRKKCMAQNNVLANPNSYANVVLSNGMKLSFRLYWPKCNSSYYFAKNTCASITISQPPFETGKTLFVFWLTRDGIVPAGHPTNVGRHTFKQYCDPSITEYINQLAPMGACTAWVIYNGNMDYLRCFDKLSWDGAHSCKEAEEKEN